MESDYSTQVSASTSGSVVAVSIIGIRDDDIHQLKLVQVNAGDPLQWEEISVIGANELINLGAELELGFEVIEDNSFYTTFLSGEKIIKYFKYEKRWYTLTSEEMGPYLAGVGQDPAMRLFQELTELKPITVGSLAIKEIASSVMSAEVNITVSNYSYVASKVVAVALDIGTAIIIPDCAMGYRLQVSGDAFKCEACPLNINGEPDCSFESSQTLNEESEIPKPKDVFMQLEQTLRWSPKPSAPAPDLVDPRRTTFP